MSTESRYARRTATTQGITSVWWTPDPDGEWIKGPHQYERAPAQPSTIAQLRQALRAYDLAGPLTDTRRQALGTILTMARQLTEE